MSHETQTSTGHACDYDAEVQVPPADANATVNSKLKVVGSRFLGVVYIALHWLLEETAGPLRLLTEPGTTPIALYVVFVVNLNDRFSTWSWPEIRYVPARRPVIP